MRLGTMARKMLHSDKLSGEDSLSPPGRSSSLFVCLPARLSIYLPVYMYLCVYLYLPTYSFMDLSTLSIRPSHSSYHPIRMPSIHPLSHLPA